MGGCTVSALGLIVVVHVLYDHSTKRHTQTTIILMVLSYAILNLSGLSEAISFFQRIDTTSTITTNFNGYTNQLYVTNISKSETTINQTSYFITATNTSKSETVAETVAATKSTISRQKAITSKSTQTLLAFTSGRNISDYVTNFSVPNAQVIKIAVKEQARRGEMFLYLFTVISIAGGFISMTIFSLLYFHFILPPQSEMS